MRKNITHYSILISCPGDIRDDIKAVEKAIQKFNKSVAESLDIYLEALHWSKDTYAQSGGHPQDLINEQIVYPSDMAIAIFWTRFGSPTSEFNSGTEEEISEMIRSGKQVFLFFSRKKIDPSSIDHIQYKQVIAFKEKYSTTGLYNEYRTLSQLEDMVFQNLSKHFISKIRKSDMDTIVSSLKISCITDNQLCSNLQCAKFDPSGYYDIIIHLQAIKLLVSEINENVLEDANVDSRTDIGSGFQSALLSSYRKVTISDESRNAIEKTCSALGFLLVDRFFSLGNLKENTLAYFSSGPQYKGTDAEIKQYERISDLCRLVEQFEDLREYILGLTQLFYVKLALGNTGVQVDENIDVQIRFPRGSVVDVFNFKEPSNNCCNRLVDDDGCTKLFSIQKSLLYKEYWDSIQTRHILNRSMPTISMHGYHHDYVSDYYTDLENTFPYEYYQENDFDVICLHFDRIKHNTNVAFPTVILLHSSIKEISYNISSSKAPEIIEGKLTEDEY